MILEDSGLEVADDVNSACVHVRKELFRIRKASAIPVERIAQTVSFSGGISRREPEVIYVDSLFLVLVYDAVNLLVAVAFKLRVIHC